MIFDNLITLKFIWGIDRYTNVKIKDHMNGMKMNVYRLTIHM